MTFKPDPEGAGQFVPDAEPVAAPKADFSVNAMLAKIPDEREIDHHEFTQRTAVGEAKMGALSKMVAGAEKGFGEIWNDGATGLEPGGETEKWFQDVGLLHRPGEGTAAAMIRMVPDAGIRTGAYMLGLAAKLYRGGARGAAGALTGGDETAMDEATAAADVLPFGKDLHGSPEGEFQRIVRTPDGQVVDDHVGPTPQPHDMAAAADLATKAAENAGVAKDRLAAADHVTSKVKALYEEHGIHPAEVAGDIANNPELAKDLASDSPVLPSFYTGFDPATAQTEALTRDRVAKGMSEPPKLPEGITPETDAMLQQRIVWPKARLPDDAAPSIGHNNPPLSMKIGDAMTGVADSITPDWAQMIAAPMAHKTGSLIARATAKDYANMGRVVEYDHRTIDRFLEENFTPERRQAMWEAADTDSVLLEKGQAAYKMAQLAPAERHVVERLQQRAVDNWQSWMALPGTKAGQLQSFGRMFVGYMPRYVMDYFRETGGETRNLNMVGRNLRTFTDRTLRREHGTVEETEAAAGPGAKVVRDVRTLALANYHLERAIMGRKLIQAVKEHSEAVGDETSPPAVVSGNLKEHEEGKYFTIKQNGSFWEHRPAFKDGKVIKNEETGNPVFEKVPIHVSKDWEGPLRSVLQTNNLADPAYKAFMAFKAKSTAVLMFSPALHNGVIFGGRVLPAVNGNPIAALRMYRMGGRVMRDPDLMREFIAHGTAPVNARRGAGADISAIYEPPKLEPGNSWTSQILGHSVGYLPQKGMSIAENRRAVKSSVDEAGHFWHQTMLWDVIARAQMGMSKTFADRLMAGGLDRQSAMRVGADMGNRFAGVIPREEIGQAGRQLADVTFFSRGFTLGNMAAAKSIFTGAPRSVLAQIELDKGIQALFNVRSTAQRKYMASFAIDYAYLHIGNSLLQSGANVMSGQDDLDDELKGYWDRLKKTATEFPDNPYQSFIDPLGKLDATSENEPGKVNRILWGFDSQGTGLYARNPTGKIPEDMVGWLTHPFNTAWNKMSTELKPAIEIMRNEDYMGHPIVMTDPKTWADSFDNMGHYIGHYLGAQIPEADIGALGELLQNKETHDEATVDVRMIGGALLGVMMSHGARGGPYNGVIAQQKRMDAYHWDEMYDDVRKDVIEGRIDQAKAKMKSVNMAPGLANWFVSAFKNPSAKIMKAKTQALLQSMPEDEQEQVERMLERQKKATGK